MMDGKQGPPIPFEWGSRPLRSAAGGIPYLQYEPRRHRAAELLVEAGRWGSCEHLVQGSRRLSYDRFLSAVDRVAFEFIRRGLRPGQRILLVAANSPEWVVAFWAGLRAGAVVAPGNSWWSEAEMEHAVALLDPALVVGDSRRLSKLPPGVDRLDLVELGPVVDSTDQVEADAVPKVAVGDENEPALVLFTSGTTGFPKGVTLSHRAVIANFHNLLAVSGRLPHQVADDQPGAVSLATGPLFHVGGLQALGLALLTGGTLVFLEGRFDPTAVLDIIERERVSVWGAVPTMALRVLDDPTLVHRDLSCVRSISLGGAPVPPELVARLRSAFPNAERGVSTVYGMTETGGAVASASGALMAKHPRTSGRPMPVAEIRIVDADESGTGEIAVRTPGAMIGYWGEDPGAVIDGEGFVRTGDLGYLEDGLLYVTGRSKDVVIRGGENIAAAHVEAALLEHPGVADAAVIGWPNPDFGEEVAAAVVAAPGADPDPVVLGAFVAGRLAHFEVPTRWWVLREPLPTNSVGKVDKRRLREEWALVEGSAQGERSTSTTPS
jgi:long-chain acyl-CoA synthetase